MRKQRSLNGSVQRRLAAERQLGEELVRAVVAERMHERDGADVAVRAC
jgi:hypothetical protein